MSERLQSSTLSKLRAIALEAQQAEFRGSAYGDILTGLSGRKLMQCLQRFTQALCNQDTVYVEIGVFQGLTLISNAQANPSVPCFGIDNFSLFNEGRDNLAIVEGRIAKSGVKNAYVINLDYEEALRSLDHHIGSRKVGVFFVDGPHDYRSQLVPLLLAKPYLAGSCAIFVDDSNYAHVRQANGDFLRSHPEFALLFEAYTKAHVANLSPAEKEEVMASWWNGLNVMVRDPSGLLPRSYPPEDAKHLYVESHEVFRHEFAELAFSALMAAQRTLDGPIGEAEAANSELKAEMIEHRRLYPGRFRNQNTHSSNLPSFTIHA
jgi:hypothetical protein